VAESAPGEGRVAGARALESGGVLGDGIVESRLVDPQRELPPSTPVANSHARHRTAPGARDDDRRPDQVAEAQERRGGGEPARALPALPPQSHPVGLDHRLGRLELQQAGAARAFLEEHRVEDETSGHGGRGIPCRDCAYPADLEPRGLEDAGERPPGRVELQLLDPSDRRWTDSAEPCQRRPIEIELTPDIAEVLRRLHRPPPSRSVPPPGARRSPRPAARREARAVLREARSVRRATCAVDPWRRALWTHGDVRCGLQATCAAGPWHRSCAMPAVRWMLPAPS